MYYNKIKYYRKQKKMNLVEMANKVGITPGYLCHLEKGTRANPSIKVMEKICNVLNKSITEVFFQRKK